jgi:hypothetical protein
MAQLLLAGTLMVTAAFSFLTDKPQDGFEDWLKNHKRAPHHKCHHSKGKSHV